MIGYLFVDYSSIYNMSMDREEIDLTDVSALSDAATLSQSQFALIDIGETSLHEIYPGSYLRPALQSFVYVDRVTK